MNSHLTLMSWFFQQQMVKLTSMHCLCMFVNKPATQEFVKIMGMHNLMN